MRAAELMKTALQNEDCGVATVILRERAERWKEEQSGVELNEYDWGGRILAEIEKMGGRSLAERFADRSTDWRQIRPELRQAVIGEVERRQEARTKELKKGQEEGVQPWCKDWRTARNSLTTQEVEYVEKARTGGVAVEMETGRWRQIREDRRRCSHCNARRGTLEHAACRCKEFDDERDEAKLKLRELGLADACPWGVIVKGGVEFRQEGSLKKRQEALRILNTFIKEIDEKKRRKLQEGKQQKEEKTREDFQPPEVKTSSR